MAAWDSVSTLVLHHHVGHQGCLLLSGGSEDLVRFILLSFIVIHSVVNILMVVGGLFVCLLTYFVAGFCRNI